MTENPQTYTRTKHIFSQFHITDIKMNTTKNELEIDFAAIDEALKAKTDMILIQRSRGYSIRKSLDIDTIEEIVKIAKQRNQDCICFVDNYNLLVNYV